MEDESQGSGSNCEWCHLVNGVKRAGLGEEIKSMGHGKLEEPIQDPYMTCRPFPWFLA